MITCPTCSRANPAGAQFCHADGTALVAGAQPLAQTRTTRHDRPVLGLSPKRVWLRDLRRSERRGETISIQNQGTGTLSGHVRVTQGSEWLCLGSEITGRDSMSLEVSSRETLDLRPDPTQLTVPGSYLAKLEIKTNGGTFELPVQVDTAATRLNHPDPHWSGVANTKDLAKRMCADPRKAAELLETSAVFDWFAENGWAIPFIDQPAPGLASAQQFLEQLRFTSIPAVSFLPDENAPHLIPGKDAGLAYSCSRGDELIHGAVTVGTERKRKLVYAFAESDAGWLALPTEAIWGVQRAELRFTIDPGWLDVGPSEGHVRLRANGGQELTLTVGVEVQDPAGRPFTRRLARKFGFGS